MVQPPTYYGPTNIEEFYSNYVASLLNSLEGNQSKKVKKQVIVGRSLRAHVMVYGIRVNISETAINRFLFRSDNRASLDGQYIARLLRIMDEGWMFDSSSQTELLTWIAEWIAIKRVVVPWVINPKVPICKVSLNFVAKFGLAVVRKILHPIGNDNMLQLSYASLVASLMDKFGINVGRIIAIEM